MIFSSVSHHKKAEPTGQNVGCGFMRANSQKDFVPASPGKKMRLLSICLDDMAPNRLTPIKKLKKLALQQATDTRALKSTPQSTLIRERVASQDFTNLRVIRPNVGRQLRSEVLNTTNPATTCLNNGRFFHDAKCSCGSPSDLLKKMKELIAVDKRCKRETDDITDIVNGPEDTTSETESLSAQSSSDDSHTESCRERTQALQENRTTADAHKLRLVNCTLLNPDSVIWDQEKEQDEVVSIKTIDVVIPGDCSPTTSHSANERTLGEVQPEKTPSKSQPDREQVYTDHFKELCDLMVVSPIMQIPLKQTPKAPPAASKLDDDKLKDKEKITLSDWFVKSVESRGVCVEGKRSDSDVYWHSNIIAHRIQQRQVKTISGQVYELVGKADTASMNTAGYPSWLVEKFTSGFPEDWKKYVRYFCEAANRFGTDNAGCYSPVKPPKNNNVTRDSRRVTDCVPNSPDTDNDRVQRKVKGRKPKSVSDKELGSVSSLSIVSKARSQKSKSSDYTPLSDCSSVSGISRSGRQIKPVLKYWCGERLSVDCLMNANVIRVDMDPLSTALERAYRGPGSKRIKKSNSETTQKRFTPQKMASNARAQNATKRTLNKKRATQSFPARDGPHSPRVVLTPMQTKNELRMKCLQNEVYWDGSMETATDTSVFESEPEGKTEREQKTSGSRETPKAVSIATSNAPKHILHATVPKSMTTQSSSKSPILTNTEESKRRYQRKSPRVLPVLFKNDLSIKCLEDTSMDNSGLERETHVERGKPKMEKKMTRSKKTSEATSNSSICLSEDSATDMSVVLMENRESENKSSDEDYAPSLSIKRKVRSLSMKVLPINKTKNICSQKNSRKVKTNRPKQCSYAPRRRLPPRSAKFQNNPLASRKSQKKISSGKDSKQLSRTQKTPTPNMKREKSRSAKVLSGKAEIDEEKGVLGANLDQLTSKSQNAISPSPAPARRRQPSRSEQPSSDLKEAHDSKPENGSGKDPRQQRSNRRKKPILPQSAVTRRRQPFRSKQPLSYLAESTDSEEDDVSGKDSEEENVSGKDSKQLTRGGKKRAPPEPAPATKRQPFRSTRPLSDLAESTDSEEENVSGKDSKQLTRGGKKQAPPEPAPATRRQPFHSTQPLSDLVESQDSEEENVLGKESGQLTRTCKKLTLSDPALGRKKRQGCSAQQLSDIMECQDSEEETITRKASIQLASNQKKQTCPDPAPGRRRQPTCSAQTLYNLAESYDSEEESECVKDSLELNNDKKKQTPFDHALGRKLSNSDQYFEEKCGPRNDSSKCIISPKKSIRSCPTRSLGRPLHSTEEKNESREDSTGQINVKRKSIVSSLAPVRLQSRSAKFKNDLEDSGEENGSKKYPAKRIRPQTKTRTSTPSASRGKSSGSTERETSKESEIICGTKVNGTGYPKESDNESNDNDGPRGQKQPKRNSKHLDKVYDSCLKKRPQTSKGSFALKSNVRSKSENLSPLDLFAEISREEEWTGREVKRLYKAVSSLPKHKKGFWLDVAMVVGSRSAEQCQEKYLEKQQTKSSKAQSKKKPDTAKKKKQENKSNEKETVKITAKVGTLKRKQQMREFLDQIQKDDHDDLFSATPFQNKKVKLPTLRASHEDDVFQLANPDPTTPSSSVFPLAYTPQCEHITPGMLETINKSNNDKYVYRIQKTSKRDKFMNWGNINKRTGGFSHATPTSRRTPYSKKVVGTKDTSVIGKLFKKDDPVTSDDEEKDYYFSDSSAEGK